MLGLSAFLMYSLHEGMRGISLDPTDHTETLMPISGTLFAVGVDFHAGKHPSFCLFLYSHCLSLYLSMHVVISLLEMHVNMRNMYHSLFIMLSMMFIVRHTILY